ACTPVCVLKIVTLASGTTALVESVTVPRMLPVLPCANKEPAKSRVAVIDTTSFLLNIPITLRGSISENPEFPRALSRGQSKPDPAPDLAHSGQSRRPDVHFYVAHPTRAFRLTRGI